MFTNKFAGKNHGFPQELPLGNYLTKKCVLFKHRDLWYHKVTERDQALVLLKLKNQKLSGGIYHE